MKNFDVVTIGGATLDIMFGTSQAEIFTSPKTAGGRQLIAFALGSKIVSRDVIYTYGGGAANTAASFSKLGLKTSIITAIGRGPHGQGLIDKLQNLKVDCARIQLTSAPTGLSFVVTGGQKRDHVIFVHRSANDLLQISPAGLLGFKAKWFYLSSLSGRLWEKNLRTVFAAAVKNNVKVAWNPGGSQLSRGYAVLKKYFKQTDALILNKDEARSLVARAGLKTGNLSQLLKALYQWGPKIVAITEGDKGAAVCSGELVCFEKPLPVVGVNTTGAGDAFGSSLVGGLLLYGGDLKKALRLAMLRSNYVVRLVGAQEGLLTLAAVKRLKYKI